MFKNGYFLLFLASFCYAVMGVLIRLLGNQFTPLSQVFLRYLVVAAISFIIVKQRKRFFKPLNFTDLIFIILTCALAYGFTNVFFTLATLNTTLSSTFFLTSTYGVITPILALILFKEKLNPRLLLAMGIAFIGSYFLFNPSGGSAIGAIFALMAALLFSLYFMGRKRLAKYSAETMMLYSTGFGAVSVGLASFFLEKSFYFSTIGMSLINVSPFGWFIFFLFVLDTYATWWLVNKGMSLVPAGKGSLILLLESVWGTGIGVLLYSEPLTAVIILGCVLVLSGSVLASTS